jgi:hypothetical protein
MLIDKGWVQRDGRNLVTATDQAKANLYELTQSALRYLQELEPALAARRPPDSP